MDYQKVYDSLISNCAGRVKSKNVYYEAHHIIPKCMGGNNSTANIVLLTAREHYIAHRLLYNIHKTPKLAHAWFCMMRTSSSQNGNRKYSARQYEAAKMAHIDAMRSYTGSKNGFYGKKHNNTTKSKIVTSRNKTYNDNPELYESIIEAQKERMSTKHKGVPKSESHKAKIGKHTKGRTTLKNIITGKSIRVASHHSGLYSKHIWFNPYTIARTQHAQIINCPYCDKSGESNNSSFKKWHFNNCKMAPNYVKIHASKRDYKKFWSPWFESKCNDHAIQVYSKLFEIENLVNSNLQMGSKSIIQHIMQNLSFTEEHRYYVRTCRKNILAGNFCESSKSNLITTLGINNESNKY